MKIDCTTCVVRGPACDDCVVSVLVRRPAPAGDRAPDRATVHLDDEEQAAVRNLAAAGLVPPLRLVAPAPVLRLAVSNSSADRVGSTSLADRRRRREQPRQWGETDIA